MNLLKFIQMRSATYLNNLIFLNYLIYNYPSNPYVWFLLIFQDYVGDVTSKYLPASHSPWQLHIITLSPPRNFYLVRVHHLLLRQEQLALGDFLPLGRAPWAPEQITSPFANLYPPPSALPRLHQKLTESFSNVWNEFLCNNDPTERPEILKKRISLWQCAKINVIVYFSSVKEITR